MAIGAVGGFDYEKYKQPINYTSGVNPFGPQATQTSAKKQPTGMYGAQERSLDPQMLATKAQGFQNGLGGTNNPDDHKIFFAA